MKKLLRHMLVVIVFGCSNSMMSQCDNYNIVVSGGFYPSEVSWSFTSSTSTVVASGFAFADEVICLPSGCYTMNMFDSFGDGWNGANFTITGPSGMVGSGTFTTGSMGTQIVSLGGGDCCPAGTESFSLEVTSGFYPEEISWSLQTGSGVTVTSGGAPYFNTLCVPSGCYQFIMSDFFGDGWDAAQYIFKDADGVVIATGTLAMDTETDMISLGTNCVPDCPAGQLPYLFTVSGGFYPTEVSWDLLDPGDAVVLTGGAPSAQYFCATEECYQLDMFDLFGDGWNGSEWVLYDENGNETQAGTLSFGSAGSIQLEIGSADCGIPDPVTASDCMVAVNICENFAFTIDPNGQGLINEIPPLGSLGNPDLQPGGALSPWGNDNYGCLRANELNSTWMIINIWQGGTLQFIFGGMGTQAGFYDWIMYPYDPDNTCQDIYNNVLPPVRCNWNWASTGGTGLMSTIPSGGNAGNYEPPLTVATGDQYIICFSNYSSVTTAVPLDFSGTAVVGCEPLMLPVELLSFSGRYENGMVILDWTTLSENNNSHFDILYSEDNLNWSTIGRIEGHGTTQQVMQYSFIDDDPQAGIQFYKLKQVDFNGNSKESGVVDIEIPTVGLFVYPNPNDGEFTVHGIASVKTLRISNSLGQHLPFTYRYAGDRLIIDLDKNVRGLVFLSDATSPGAGQRFLVR